MQNNLLSSTVFKKPTPMLVKKLYFFNTCRVPLSKTQLRVQTVQVGHGCGRDRHPC